MDDDTEPSIYDVPWRTRTLHSLAMCPPGPFLFQGQSIGIKTEYTMLLGVRNLNDEISWHSSGWPEAFCMDSGEVFWGGTSKHEDRAALMVVPILIEEIPDILAAIQKT
jgi:hypothetical protein